MTDLDAFLRATTLRAPRRARLRRRLLGGGRRWGIAPWLGAFVFGASAFAAGVWVGGGGEGSPLQAALDGEGALGGTSDAPVLAWRAGRVELGPGLVVRTPEGDVTAGAGPAVVERDRHATRVSGQAEVVCRGAVHLDDGGKTCLPADLATLLVRAAELSRDAAPPEERLDTVAAGLALAGPGTAERGELLAHRVAALRDRGDTDEALAAAEQYLADPGLSARRAELAAFVALARADREGCGARDALERAVAADPTAPPALVLAGCVAGEDPLRARALVDGAPPADAAWADYARAVRQRLEGR